MLFIFLVQFSPAGHYFASSSHDRTARIWSMDRIQPLRIMAGHLSDVDVSFKVKYPLSSACSNFLHILYHPMVHYNDFIY